MRRAMQGRGGMVIAFVLGLMIATAGTAGAARLITGKQIKDGSISEKDLSKALRKAVKATGKAGPQGPAGPKGEPGAVGGIAKPQVTTVKTLADNPGVNCRSSRDLYCGSIESGKYWGPAAALGAPGLSYAVEPSGFVQLQGTAQRTGTMTEVDSEAVFYLPSEVAPIGTLRFPIATIDEVQSIPLHPQSSPAFAWVANNGEVRVVGAQDGKLYDLSSIRFRVKPTG